MSALASIALVEFNRRKASIDAAVNAGRFPRERGEALLACWLTIGLLCGAPPSAFGSMAQRWLAQERMPENVAARWLIEDGPIQSQWQAELERARNEAGRKARARHGDAALSERWRCLDALAIYLGCADEPGADASAGRGNMVVPPRALTTRYRTEREGVATC